MLVRGSCFHSLVAHGPTLAALVTPPRVFVLYRHTCMLTHVTNKTHSWLIIHLKLRGRGLSRHVKSTLHCTTLHITKKIRAFQDQTMSFTPCCIFLNVGF